MPFSSPLPPACKAVLRPLALALMACAAQAQAQDLQTLYGAARDYDATYLSARALADSAQSKADQAMALRLPGVSLAGSLARNESETGYGVTSNVTSNSRGVTLSAQQNIYNRANSLTIDQADKAVAVAQAQLRAAEQDLIVRLSQAYFDVLASSDALGTVQASKKAIAEQLASAKRNFEVGTATITDTREAQARYDLALAQELAAENDLLVKGLALEQLVGRNGVKPQPLAVPVVLPAVQPARVDAWLAAAEQNSPAVAQAILGLDVARLETEKAQAGHLPTVALTGSLAKGRVNGDQTSSGGSRATSAFSGDSTTKAIALTVTVPLFSGFAVENRVKETLALESKSSADLENARRTIAQSTRSAFFGVQSGIAQVKALEAAESSSKLALESTLLGYKVGVRVNLDVLTAQTQLFQTQRDLAKARYDVIVGGLRLRQASGQLRPEDVAAVNLLLAR